MYCMQKHLNQVMVLNGQMLYLHGHSNPVFQIALATVKEATKTYNLFCCEFSPAPGIKPA